MDGQLTLRDDRVDAGIENVEGASSATGERCLECQCSTSHLRPPLAVPHESRATGDRPA